MADDLDRYIDDLPNRQNKWMRRIVNPFTESYLEATKLYDDTMKKAGEEKQKEIELAMLALSIIAGATLVASFGTSALSTIALERALTTVCNKNMERAFSLMVKVEASKTATFVVGQAWAAAETKITADIKKKLNDRLVAQSKAVQEFRQDPLKIYLCLDNYVRDLAIAGHDFAEFVRDSNLFDAATKNKIGTYLRSTPFFNPPDTNLDKASATNDIELAMYLSFVLTLDSFNVNKGAGGPYWGRTDVDKTTEIKDAPSSPSYPAEYNKVKSWRDGFNAGVVWDRGTIEYGEIPGKLETRIRELAKDKLVANPVKAQTLRTAEQKIYQLNEKNLRLLSQSLNKK